MDSQPAARPLATAVVAAVALLLAAGFAWVSARAPAVEPELATYMAELQHHTHKLTLFDRRREPRAGRVDLHEVGEIAEQIERLFPAHDGVPDLEARTRAVGSAARRAVGRARRFALGRGAQRPRRAGHGLQHAPGRRRPRLHPGRGHDREPVQPVLRPLAPPQPRHGNGGSAIGRAASASSANSLSSPADAVHAHHVTAAAAVHQRPLAVRAAPRSRSAPCRRGRPSAYHPCARRGGRSRGSVGSGCVLRAALRAGSPRAVLTAEGVGARRRGQWALNLSSTLGHSAIGARHCQPDAARGASARSFVCAPRARGR